MTQGLTRVAAPRCVQVERKEMREHLSSLEHVDPTPFTDLFPGSPRAAIELLGGASLPNSRKCRLAQFGTLAAFSSPPLSLTRTHRISYAQECSGLSLPSARRS